MKTRPCFAAPLPVGASRALRAATCLSTAARRPAVAARPARLPPRRARPCATLLQDRQVTVGDALVALRVESMGGRRRRVSGGVDVAQPAQRVWRVLTSYDRNADYIPNIISSTVERGPEGIFLEQVGIISNKLRLRTTMLMSVKEHRDELRISFTRLKARDFSSFEGVYKILDHGADACRLEYEVTAVPIPIYPVSLVERKITKEVPGMLAAIRKEAMVGNFIPF